MAWTDEAREAALETRRRNARGRIDRSKSRRGKMMKTGSQLVKSAKSFNIRARKRIGAIKRADRVAVLKDIRKKMGRVLPKHKSFSNELVRQMAKKRLALSRLNV